MIPNLSELCMDAVFAPGDCGGDLKLPGREQGSLQSLMDQIDRFAASVCYTTNIADLLLTDMLNPVNMQIESCIVNKLCEGKHSYELGWVDSSYRLTRRTGEDMWTVSVIVRSRKYQTRRHAWLMCDEEEDPSQWYEQENVNTRQADVMRRMRLRLPVFFNRALKSWNEFEAKESVLDLKYTGDPELTELTLSVEKLNNLSNEENTLHRKRPLVDTGGGVEELKTAYLTKLRIYVPLKAWFNSNCDSWTYGSTPVYALALWRVWLLLPVIKDGVAKALEVALLVPGRELVLAVAKETKCGEGRGSLLS